MAEIIKHEHKIEFTNEQVELVRKQIAPNASSDELKLFLYQCQRTGLDPLTRQIYCIHRGGKMTIQTSIDGFRVIAERSGEYAGQDEPVFTEENGKIICCKVTVYKFSANGTRYPAAVGVAYWDEYAQTSPMWQKFKHTMLAKCAEALALRKAFPQDLSGIYTSDEMEQAGTPEEVTDVPTKEERDLLKSLVYNSDLTETEQEQAFEKIDTCTNYKSFEKIQHRLEERQKSIDTITNPSQKDINQHLKKVQA